jgi:hypothetical protein
MQTVIKTNSLRIGNLIKFKKFGEHRYTVIETDIDTLILLEWAEQIGEEARILPIPITDKWLKRFGFYQCESPIPDCAAYCLFEDGSRIVWCAGHVYKMATDGYLRITKDNQSLNLG